MIPALMIPQQTFKSRKPTYRPKTNSASARQELAADRLRIKTKDSFPYALNVSTKTAARLSGFQLPDHPDVLLV